MVPIGGEEAFDYAALKGRARALATARYQTPSRKLPPSLAALDWDAYQALHFKDDHAIWADDKLRFQIKLFHLGLFFKRPVRMHALKDGKAQMLAYRPDMFDYGKSGLDGSGLPADLGFAGFRVNIAPKFKNDVAAFLGASYFRAVGAEGQYGLSARGLAVDTALPRDEEFPDFTDFYFEEPAPDADTLVVYALLDAPSIAGAYRFAITSGEPLLMDIDAALYPRKTIERLGIAPCTSMYQTGENDRHLANDWRPEIHDSDGLSMHTGSGEWIWRPLVNPRNLRFNAFGDKNPRGFGLLQRDRNFDHYQDDGVFYNKRPSLWVEPKSDWGEGAIDLVEIPTIDETFDNIVAFWNPAKKPEPGQELLFGYRLFWGSQAPAQSSLAHCVATRTGLGGIVGQKRKYFSWRFALDFAGGPLKAMSPDERKGVEIDITASAGSRIEITSARPLDAIDGIRALFDIVPGDSRKPIDLRVFLKRGSEALSETWIYQWTPPPSSERKFAFAWIDGKTRQG
ncbi:MAG: glucan biosynthesis protein D [Variovorax sp.]